MLSLWHDRLKLLVVTDGEKGCRYYTKVSFLTFFSVFIPFHSLIKFCLHFTIHAQSFKGKVSGFSVKTVDTTGAGDAFVGSLLVSIAKDPSIFQVQILYSTKMFTSSKLYWMPILSSLWYFTICIAFNIPKFCFKSILHCVEEQSFHIWMYF